MAIDKRSFPEESGSASAGSKCIFPSKTDYSRRIARAQDAMEKQRVDVILLHGTGNHRFFTGLDGLPDVRPIFLVLLPDAEPTLVSPRIEAPIIRKKCSVKVAAEWGDWDEPGMFRSFCDAIAAHVHEVAPNATTIGVDYNTTTALNLDLLRKKLEPARLQDISMLTNDVRRENDAATTHVFSAAVDVALYKMLAIQKAIVPGAKEWQAALKGYNAMTERAAEYLNGDENHCPLGPSFIAMGSGRERTSHAHSVASGRVMNSGDLVQICCCTPPLLGHDMCFDRPVVVGSGELPQDVRKIVTAARAASAAAWQKVRPGVTAGEVHAAAAAVIEKYGFQDGLQHGTGRSIGCGDVGFRIMAGDPTVLKKGDVIGIEPGVYQYGVGGARYGDTGVVTADGYKLFTPFDLSRDF
jgi:Xaa-Pro aminopeptidase